MTVEEIRAQERWNLLELGQGRIEPPGPGPMCGIAEGRMGPIDQTALVLDSLALQHLLNLRRTEALGDGPAQELLRIAATIPVEPQPLQPIGGQRLAVSPGAHAALNHCRSKGRLSPITLE